MKRPDTVSLILGLLATPLALAGLWLSFGGHLGWNTIKIAGPMILILIGIIGLVVSRSRQ